MTSPSVSSESARSQGSSRTPAPRAERVAGGVLSCLFLFAAAVQYNDPDPLGWAAMYLAAAVVCAGHAIRPMSFVPGALVALVALLWAATLAPAALAVVPSFAELTGTFRMMAPGVEELREFGGLLIIAAATGGLALRARRRGPRAAGGAQR